MKIEIEDLISVKDLPDSGSFKISDLPVFLNSKDLFQVLKRYFEGRGFPAISDIEENPDYICWIVTGGGFNLWATGVDFSDQIKFQDYFTVKEDSLSRGFFHSNKFSL